MILNIQLKNFENLTDKILNRVLPKSMEIHSHDSTGGFFKTEIDHINSITDIIKSLAKRFRYYCLESYLVGIIEIDNKTFIIISNGIHSDFGQTNYKLLDKNTLELFNNMQRDFNQKNINIDTK